MAAASDSERPSPVHIFYDKIKEVAGEEYEALNQLKKKGKQSPDYEAHFQQQRHTAKNANPNLCSKWYMQMSDILQEIDSALAVFPKDREFRFLDLGSSPGGFSRYILRSNESARGTGVSLPPQQGGHKNLLEIMYRRRLTLVEADITMFNLTPDEPVLFRGPRSMEALPSCVGSRQFEFVICDAHPLPNGGFPPSLTSQRVLLSQLVMALDRVELGGTIIFKFTHPERLYTAQYMYMFDRVSNGQVFTKKPETMHGTRGSFYLVAKNVGGTEESSRGYVEIYLEELRRLWWEISREDARLLMYGDMNFVAPLETMIRPEVLARIIELGRPVWSVQLNQKHLEQLDVRLAQRA